jgi:acyl-CoA reductase-like NAD-dependent aldehyde dehydrogenase
MDYDKDLAARQEARSLCRRAEMAQKQLINFSQQQLDAIVEAMAKAFSVSAVELAELAAKETGFGNPEDKVVKNRFASETVAKRIRDMKTVGVLSTRTQEKIWEVGVPVGLIAAIVPSTNPTSTVCYKALIALKSGNAIVFSPHPKAAACTIRAAELLAAAAVRAGAPKGSISCLTMASMAGCQELMQRSGPEHPKAASAA